MTSSIIGGKSNALLLLVPSKYQRPFMLSLCFSLLCLVIAVELFFLNSEYHELLALLAFAFLLLSYVAFEIFRGYKKQHYRFVDGTEVREAEECRQRSQNQFLERLHEKVDRKARSVIKIRLPDRDSLNEILLPWVSNSNFFEEGLLPCCLVPCEYGHPVIVGEIIGGQFLRLSIQFEPYPKEEVESSSPDTSGAA